MSQRLREFTCHIADDCSTDRSIDVIHDTIKRDRRFRVSQNSTRLFQLGTYQRLLADTTLKKDDIVVSVDGDDWLPDPGVLQRVAEAYADGQTWITYGSHKRSNGRKLITEPLEDAALIRQVSWRTSHLRTWKVGLWRQIRPESFLDQHGNTFRCAGDVAWMFPMIEMAGNAHSKHLPDCNYIYNVDNPQRCGETRREEQFANARWLRRQTPYEPLESL